MSPQSFIDGFGIKLAKQESATIMPAKFAVRPSARKLFTTLKELAPFNNRNKPTNYQTWLLYADPAT